MTVGQLQIHSQNILPIIKKWLYTDKDIFIRELVANSCDAIHKVKILRDQGEANATDEEFRIDLRIDREAKTLTFSDTGIGMNSDEVEKYIAQIAFSGAEDFVGKYQTNREQDQIIGHFGLGFYSAYMVADMVEIDTLSYREGSTAAKWRCDGSPEYTLEQGTRSTRGTTIVLHIGEDGMEYLNEDRLRSILKQYCSFLQYPIYLHDERINSHEPLWIKTPAECSKNDYLAFYRFLYPMEEEPLFWVHLNVDYPFHLKGILYFPKLRRDVDQRMDSVNLYCNRVFVADNCKDILPDFLMVLRGAIDSPDIPLNVSRSTLQRDRTVSQLSSHITKKVSDSLSQVFKEERQRYIDAWSDVEIIVKLGLLEDDKFYNRIKDYLIWKNTDGEWTTLNEYLERNRDKTGGKILYTNDSKQAFEFLQIYHEKDIEVLHSNPLVDPMVMSFIEQKENEITFQRIDGGIDDTILDSTREKTILDTDGKTESARLAEFVRLKLDDESVDVEAKSLASNSLPGFVLIDEQQRRVRDYLRKIDSSAASAPHNGIGKHSFIVNTNSGLINSLQRLNNHDPDLTKDVVRELYQLSLLSQREIPAKELNEFIQRTTGVLEKLTNKVIG